LNLGLLKNSLKNLNINSLKAKESIGKIIDLIELEEKNKRALGIDESKIFKASETGIEKIFKILRADRELQGEIAIDETNYSNKLLELSEEFSSLGEVFVNYKKDDLNIVLRLISANLKYKIGDLLNKTKALVFMSGTLHSKEVLKHIFGIDDFEIVQAEKLVPGNLEIIRTGSEFDCKYSGFSSGKYTRKDYLNALNQSVLKSKKPCLIHVQAFQDLPDGDEILEFEELMDRQELIDKQRADRFGEAVEKFKNGDFKKLFSTKCARGVDFPGEKCNSIVFTKYPNPNVQDLFWKVIMETHRDWYWEFYRDKARREFLQKIYRAVRFKDDKVFILSPDIRVLNSVMDLQRNISYS
jgi:Rad3-related DNA helicase